MILVEYGHVELDPHSIGLTLGEFPLFTVSNELSDLLEAKSDNAFSFILSRKSVYQTAPKLGCHECSAAIWFLVYDLVLKDSFCEIVYDDKVWPEWVELFTDAILTLYKELNEEEQSKVYLNWHWRMNYLTLFYLKLSEEPGITLDPFTFYPVTGLIFYDFIIEILGFMDGEMFKGLTQHPQHLKDELLGLIRFDTPLLPHAKWVRGKRWDWEGYDALFGEYRKMTNEMLVTFKQRMKLEQEHEEQERMAFWIRLFLFIVRLFS